MPGRLTDSKLLQMHRVYGKIYISITAMMSTLSVVRSTYRQRALSSAKIRFLQAKGYIVARLTARLAFEVRRWSGIARTGCIYFVKIAWWYIATDLILLGLWWRLKLPGSNPGDQILLLFVAIFSVAVMFFAIVAVYLGLDFELRIRRYAREHGEPPREWYCDKATDKAIYKWLNQPPSSSN